MRYKTMSQALREFKEFAEGYSRIETAELKEGTLHLIGRDSDLPFAVWNKINNSDELGIYNSYGISVDGIPKVELIVIDWEKW